MNFHHLAAIMKDLLGCDNLNSLDECLLNEEQEPPSPPHSVYKLIARLSNKTINQETKYRDIS